MKKAISLVVAVLFAVSLVSATYCEDVKEEFEVVYNGDASFNPLFDFNNDNFIDLSDFSYFGQKYGDEIWCKGIMDTIYPPVTETYYIGGGSGGMHRDDIWELLIGIPTREYKTFWDWLNIYFMPRSEINDRLDRIEAIAYLGSSATEYKIGMATAIIKAKRTGEPVSFGKYLCSGDLGCIQVTSLSS